MDYVLQYIPPANLGYLFLLLPRHFFHDLYATMHWLAIGQVLTSNQRMAMSDKYTDPLGTYYLYYADTSLYIKSLVYTFVNETKNKKKPTSVLLLQSLRTLGINVWKPTEQYRAFHDLKQQQVFMIISF